MVLRFAARLAFNGSSAVALAVVGSAGPALAAEQLPSASNQVKPAAVAAVPAGAPATPTVLLAQAPADSAIEQLQQENQELKQRLQRLEQLLNVTPPAAGQAELPGPLLPKNGFYIQGDLGGQHRDLAGENGYTVTSFQGGFYGNVGVGYRYSKNFRFSAEYANLSSNVDTVAACYIPASPKGGGCGATPSDGKFFPGEGAIVLNQYTLNAYYDLDGFGERKRFRPFVGIGVGTQKSTIINLSNTQAEPYGLIANGNAWAPLITFSAGLSYVFTQNSEIFVGGKYALGSELLFDDTDFGDLLPQSSRNWIINGGFRYTF